MARNTVTVAGRPAQAGDDTGKPARLPEDVHSRAAALAVAIRVRKARGLAQRRTHKGRTRPVLVRA